MFALSETDMLLLLRLTKLNALLYERRFQNLNHTGISVGNTVHLKYRILSVRKRSKLCRYIEKLVCANVTLKYR